MGEARGETETKGSPHHFRDFTCSTPNILSRARRVIGNAGWTRGEADPCFVVTLLKPAEAEARRPYEAICCAAGEWKCGSRHANSTGSPTAPRPPPCEPTDCARGLHPLPVEDGLARDEVLRATRRSIDHALRTSMVIITRMAKAGFASGPQAPSGSASATKAQAVGWSR